MLTIFGSVTIAPSCLVPRRGAFPLLLQLPPRDASSLLIHHTITSERLKQSHTKYDIRTRAIIVRTLFIPTSSPYFPSPITSLHGISPSNIHNLQQFDLRFCCRCFVYTAVVLTPLPLATPLWCPLLINSSWLPSTTPCECPSVGTTFSRRLTDGSLS